jgi:hypothetical protein
VQIQLRERQFDVLFAELFSDPEINIAPELGNVLKVLRMSGCASEKSPN